MVITSIKTEGHWNYFLAIEEDLERLSRFVEFDKRNEECFSVEISRILLASAAEVDIVCKLICKKINPSSSAHNIKQYRDEILAAFPSIPSRKVILVKYGIELKPWANWNDPNGIPDWWTAYNKIKHKRDTEYHRANLKNTLNAVSGLFIVVLYLYKEKAIEGELFPSPKLLHLQEKDGDISSMGMSPMGWSHFYDL